MLITLQIKKMLAYCFDFDFDVHAVCSRRILL